jgi:hypothetical protein
MNAKVNGNGAAAQQVQVNPVEVARVALTFLARVEFRAAERQMFDLTESMLRAIVDGQVVLAPAPQPANEPTLVEAPAATQ